MRFAVLLAAAAFAVFLQDGCFRKVQEVGSEDSGSFIVVQGSGQEVTIVIDGVVAAKDVEVTPDGGVKYRVERGTHEVQVLRDGREVLLRRIYIGDGETRALSVPAQ